MRRTYLLSVTAITAVVVGASSSAQAVQPLDQFIAAASSHSFDAREVDATERQREAEADASLGRLLPVASARGVYTRNQYEIAVQLPGTASQLVIQPQNQLDAFLQLDVPIIDVAGYYRYKSARATARAAKEQASGTRLDISRAVTRSYFQYVGGAALLETAKRSVQVAEANLQSVEARRGAGIVTDLDRERARANIERARQDVADAELGMALSARALETLSGLTPTNANGSFVEDLREEAPLARWSALVGNTPQERAARELAEASAYGKKSASMNLLPSLAASGAERFTNATGFSGRESFYTLQLIASWKLDYAGIKNVSAQEAARDVADIRRERTERALVDVVFEAYRRVENGIAKSRAARAEATAATKAADLAADRYNAGVATQLDVTQAQRDAFLADARRIQADADLAFARAALRLSAGRSPSDPRSP